MIIWCELIHNWLPFNLTKTASTRATCLRARPAFKSALKKLWWRTSTFWELQLKYNIIMQLNKQIQTKENSDVIIWGSYYFSIVE